VYNVKPDLIVITGDTVDPNKYQNFASLYEKAMQFIVESGIPWAWTGGSQIKNMTRDEILAVDKELNY
jgi:hypothetical protein